MLRLIKLMTAVAWPLSFFVFSFSTAAFAELTFINDEFQGTRSTVRSSTIENDFSRLNALTSQTVHYDTGGSTKAMAIKAWGLENPKWELVHNDRPEDIDAFYYRTNKKVYAKIDKEFKGVYFALATSAVAHLKRKLQDEGINFSPYQKLSPSTFVLKNGTMPMVYNDHGKKKILTITTTALCIRQNRLVSTSLPPKIFSNISCPGGHTRWFNQIAAIEYDPLCKNSTQLCKTPDEIHQSVKSSVLSASLMVVPDGAPPTKKSDEMIR